MIAAAFDIGTNTFLMLIGEQMSDGSWRILHDEHRVARLGEGVSTSQMISETAYQRAAAIARDYAAICATYRVQIGHGVATSAVRDAINGENVCARLSEEIGFPIRCVSGDEEAALSFRGTAEKTMNLITVIDIGGGSTEYITGNNNAIHYKNSVQIGAVRLYEKFFSRLPASALNIAAARQEIRKHLAMHLLYYNTPEFVGGILGVGGTFTTLAALDMGLQEFQPNRVHNHTMSLETIRNITEYLLSSPLESLLKNPAIHPKRADILPAGALILEESLHYLQTHSCKASVKGLRYGLLYSL